MDHERARQDLDAAARYALARELCPGQRVLDLGCGTGAGAMLLSRWGARSVTGVDISDVPPSRVAETGMAFVRADACAEDGLERLGGFDLVLALGLLEEVDERIALLSTVKRRMAPGGVAVVTCPVEDEGAADAAKAFSRLAVDTLGRPTQVIFALPATGLLLVDPSRLRVATDPGILGQEDVYGAVRLPGEMEGAVRATRLIVGIWGATIPEACVMAPFEAAPVATLPARGRFANLWTRLRGKGA